MKRNLLRFLGLGVLSGCVGAEPKSRSVSTGHFNYTDRYLGDIIVDGTWTGGADAYGEGGLAEGLLAPSDPNRVAILKVQWVVADLYDIASNKYTRMPLEHKSASVEVKRPYPADPWYLFLHFYPDGHVEAELTVNPPERRIPEPPGYHRNQR